MHGNQPCIGNFYSMTKKDISYAAKQLKKYLFKLTAGFEPAITVLQTGALPLG